MAVKYAYSTPNWSSTAICQSIKQTTFLVFITIDGYIPFILEYIWLSTVRFDWDMTERGPIWLGYLTGSDLPSCVFERIIWW
jgi:hypothetical protein